MAYWRIVRQGDHNNNTNHQCTVTAIYNWPIITYINILAQICHRSNIVTGH